MKTICSSASTDRNRTGCPVPGGTTGIGQRPLALGFLKAVCLVSVLLAASAWSSRASDLVGVYAFVDKVVFEPNEDAPDRIQVFGGFALAEGRGYKYTPAQRGYMYFKLRPGEEKLCRNEWKDLKSVAGTGTIVAFGRRHTDNGTVRSTDSNADKPDVYPLGFGMQKVSPRDYKPINELIALKTETKRSRADKIKP